MPTNSRCHDRHRTSQAVRFAGGLFAVSLLLMLPARTIAQAPDLNFEDRRNELGDSLLDGLLSCVGNVRTGRFTSKWESWVGSEPPTDPAEFVLVQDTVCTFDFVNDRIRADLERNGISIPSNRAAKYYSTRESARLYIPESGMITILPPNAHLERGYNLAPIDVRLLGLATRVELMLVHDYSVIHHAFKNDYIAEGKELNDNKYQLFLYQTYRDTAIRRTIVLDASTNFIPLQYTQQYSSPENHDTQWAAPWITEQLKWKQVNEVWVPVLITIDTLNQNPILHDKITIVWEAVNQEVPDTYFTQEDLKAPDGTLVVDVSLDKDNPVKVATIGEEKASSGPPPAPLYSRRTKVGLIIGNLIILVLLPLIYILRRRVQHGKQSDA